MIQLFLFPTLLMALFLTLLFILPSLWRNALVGSGIVFFCVVWGQYFYDSSKPGHDGGAGEALGLFVMFWVTIVFVLCSALAVWVSTFRKKQATAGLLPLRQNSRIHVVGGKFSGQGGLIVGVSDDREKGDYLVALDAGLDVIFHARDLSVNPENMAGGREIARG